MTPSTKLRVFVTDGRGRALSVRGLSRWLTRVAPASARGELALALVGDSKMRELNQCFRGVDRPTDVLSFPAAPLLFHVAGRPRFLGDVVIATSVAKRRGRSAGNSAESEMRRLALHGLLHVLGYDHEQDDGRMGRLERRLLRKGGIPERLR